MSLLTRLVDPADGEIKLPVHQFMAALAELKRGAPGVTVTTVGDAFNLDAGERTELETIVSNNYVDGISRELIHDVLMLGEANLYTLQQCSDRLVNVPSTTDIWPLITAKAFEVMARGLNGSCVLSGCAVTAQGSPDMTLSVSKGSVLSQNVLRPVTAGSVIVTTAHATLPRIDIVVVDASGTKVVRAGTPASRPVPPALTAGDVAIAFVFVPQLDTTISATQLLDTRVFQATGPVLLGKVTTPVVHNSTSAAQTYVSVTIPSGLFLTGRVIRVSCGGTMLLNFGSPTVTLMLSYGGTTMFQDVTGSATADADRLAWNLSFQLTAQGDSDQALNGVFASSILGAKTAPATGLGDIAGAAALVNPISGSASVDSDTADRILLVQMTMSVGNAANEITMEYATGELI